RCWVQFGEGQFIRHDSDTDLTVPADSFDPQVLLDCATAVSAYQKLGWFPDDGMELSVTRSNVTTDLFFLYPRDNRMYFSANEHYHAGTLEWIDNLFPELDYGWMEFMGH